MHVGHVISGAGHIGLIGWVLVAGAFAPTPEPFEVTEVAMISGAEFDALMRGQEPPETATQVALPTPPETDEAPAPAPARPEPRPTPPQPEVTEAPPPDPAPAIPEPAPADPAEVQDEVTEIAPPPQEQAVIAPELSDRPVPRPALRVAPEPVAPPPPDAQVDDVVREEATPQDTADTPREEQEATAPEEATTEIVTEAEEQPAAAPIRSIRPKVRPNRPAEPEQTRTAAAPTPDPAPSDTSSAVENALAEALGGAQATGQSTAPSGPPMTAGERDALRVGVQRCWNVGSLSSDALRTTVVVAVDMNEDATPNTGSIRMLSHSGGSAASARQAFETARRAIIRCGVNGFDLPREKYGQWQQIEMTFDPSNMRIK
jgi:hypothetical protein